MAKALSKTQKKTDNTIRQVLTDVCERALKDVRGFAWLTHQADYANFPASLLITCVFHSDDDITSAHGEGALATMRKDIQRHLLKVGIVLKKLDQQIIFDSEQACEDQHGSDWATRLASRTGRAVAKNRPY